jgi:small neutral amino acid transporter SnatA (MarC family)
VIEDLPLREFIRVLVGASLTALAIFSVFTVVGESVLVNLLGVHVDALRVFGGIIFFVVGYNYVTKGFETAVALRGSLKGLPAAIALPFMVGAGTITQAILISKYHAVASCISILALGVAISFVVVVIFKLIHDHMRGPWEKLFNRYVNILARVNGLLIGAISTEMILTSARRLWAH